MATRRKKSARAKRRPARKNTTTRKRKSTSRSSRSKSVQRASVKKSKAPKKRRVPAAGSPVHAEGQSYFHRDRVVVWFRDGFDEQRERERLGARYGRVVLRPMFTWKREELRQLQIRVGRQNPRQLARNFLNYYLLYIGHAIRPDEVVRELARWGSIGLAYVDAPTENAGPRRPDQLCGNSSNHLEGLGEGVNATFAWNFEGGRGNGQILVDVEEGWTPEHVRLPVSQIVLLNGESKFNKRDHGTSVLGIACGTHLLGGCKGVAPDVAWVGLSSCIPDASVQDRQRNLPPDELEVALRENVYQAINAGVLALRNQHQAMPGSGPGVLLLERQTSGGLPVEILPTAFELIGVATGSGITVVEAAGNNHTFLDTHQDTQILSQDSGAIMVGAGTKGRPSPAIHGRLPSSNFGQRVNCYAWGEEVITPTWQPSQPLVMNLCGHFGMTSGAAAIIAGVALVVQGIIARAGAAQPSAAQLRDSLSDPALGTPCAAGSGIGVMPDLEKILRAFRVPLNRRN